MDNKFIQIYICTLQLMFNFMFIYLFGFLFFIVFELFTRNKICLAFKYD